MTAVKRSTHARIVAPYAILLFAALGGCGDDAAPTTDSGVDASPGSDASTNDAATDGGTDASETDAATDDGGTVTSKTVFVTSAVYDGNLGGADGADAKCQLLAMNAGLTGTYRAWLATSTSTPASRFTHHDGPYVLVGGTEIASNWDDLIDGNLDVAIDKTETGGVAPVTTATAGCAPSSVWTAAGNDGTFLPRSPDWHCGDWTQTTGDGTVGDFSYSADGLWTNRCGGGDSCAQTAALYCFEQ